MRPIRLLGGCLVVAIGADCSGAGLPDEPVPLPEMPVLEADFVRATSAAALIDIPRAMMPFPDVLTGGQPTAEQLRQAARTGYRAVINLRAPGEEGELPDQAELVRDLGMNYVQIPIADADGFNLANARRLSEALRDDALPAIVHCRSGGRVGALFALKAHSIDGESADDAIAIGLRAGMGGLESVVRERFRPAD